MIEWGNVPTWIAAMASIGTLVVAVTAAIVAYKQLGLARTLREDKARPFVVVDFEPTLGTGRPFMDLVIRNTGETLAKDVSITFEPPLRTTLDADAEQALGQPLKDSSIIRDGIPSMPPGREYRILFDNMADRYKSGLERRYQATIMLSSDRRDEQPLHQVLDLDLYYGHMRIDEYGLHHIAKTLRSWAKQSGVKSF